MPLLDPEGLMKCCKSALTTSSCSIFLLLCIYTCCEHCYFVGDMTDNCAELARMATPFYCTHVLLQTASSMFSRVSL